MLSCGLPSHPLKILFFARWETVEILCLSFLHTSRQMCVFNRSLTDAHHRSPTVGLALYTKGGSEPITSSPRSEFTTLSMISSNEMCGEHEIAPLPNRRSAVEFLKQMLTKVAARNRFFRKIGKFRKTKST